MDEDFVTFKEDIVKDEILGVLEDVLKEGVFIAAKVNDWTTQIVEQSLKRLASLKMDLKYAVTCHVMQRAGAGLQVADCASWDPRSDGQVTVDYHTETICAYVTVYGVAF